MFDIYKQNVRKASFCLVKKLLQQKIVNKTKTILPNSAHEINRARLPYDYRILPYIAHKTHRFLHKSTNEWKQNHFS